MYKEFQLKCINHDCQLNNACQNYHNSEGEEKYIRPQTIFDGWEKPKFRCDFLLPLNVGYIIKQSQMNDLIGYKKKRKLSFEIVEQFGGEEKKKLMKLLNALMS